MERTTLTSLFLLIVLTCSAAKVTNYKSLDATNPIIFKGDQIVYQGNTIELGPNAFFIDGQLTDEEAAKYPYVFNSVNKAAEKLTNGTEESPMVLYVAPYVYWIDDPDDPAIRLPKNGSSPYGLVIKCEWLRFYGLSDKPENVVLACNRGQSLGSDGNFTMFSISGQGTSSENITFGNYCNIDLEFPLKPELNRGKRGSAIVQAQLIHCNGDKIVARNTRFVSRLNLCPFTGGKRVLFDHCHFESTDDALCGTGVYLNCTLDFYGSKPFYNTTGTGAIFFNCDLRSFNYGDQYFTKAPGQVAALDTRLKTETANYLGWMDFPPLEMRNYQYNVTFNGEPVLISKNDPASTVDMTEKPVLDAYRLTYNGKVIYNTYNLLCGDDDWDPMGIKDIVLAAEKENGKRYTMLPVQLLVSPTRVSIETEKNEAKLNAKVLKFGNYVSEDERINWSVAPEFKSLVKLKVSEDGMTCNVIPTNTNDETRQVIVNASTPSGLQAASVLFVAPAKFDAPQFGSLPKISKDKSGKLTVDYKLDMRFEDQSLISWYRCTDAKGNNPIEIAVSRKNKPMYEYELSAGDIGYYIMASVAPKHIRCDAGETVNAVMKKAISAKDVKADGKLIHTDFFNFSTRNQPNIIPGFWTLDNMEPLANDRSRYFDKNRDAWYYGDGGEGSANMSGLMQAQNARLLYTPVGKEFGDMKLTMTVVPFKTAGQGFSMAGRYMDVLVKFDNKTMTGYALRLIRTTKYHNAIDCYFVKYENEKVTELSKPVSTSCYRPTCNILVETKGNKLVAHIESQVKYLVTPDQPEVVTEVNMETEIISNTSGGFGIQYFGGATSMIKDLKVEW